MTLESPSFPSRFRRRLTLAFVLVAAISAGALAIGSFTSVRAYRMASFRDRAVHESGLNLVLAAGRLDDASIPSLFDLYDRRGPFETLAVRNGEVVAESTPGLRGLLDDLPSVHEDGATAVGRVTRNGVPHVFVGGQPPGGDVSLYFLYSQQSVLDGLAHLRNALAGGWLLVTALAALVGSVVARRTLAPVKRAATAARALAEGLLDTRVPDRADDEFGEWGRYFNEMAAALGEKLHALAEANERHRRFTANVTHELRTPLGGLVATASLIEDRLDDLPPDVRRPAELLLHDINRLRALVLDLLELARLDAGHDDVHLEPLSLTRAVEAVVAMVVRDPPPDVDVQDMTVLADRRRVERVLSNLLDNAYRHGAPPVRIRTRVVDGCAVLDIEDHGPGIPEEDRDRIFERFFKSDPSRATSGTGLGLAIAADNAKAMGARVEVGGDDGRLTRFSLHLPVAPRPHVNVMAATTESPLSGTRDQLVTRSALRCDGGRVADSA